MVSRFLLILVFSSALPVTSVEARVGFVKRCKNIVRSILGKSAEPIREKTVKEHLTELFDEVVRGQGEIVRPADYRKMKRDFVSEMLSSVESGLYKEMIAHRSTFDSRGQYQKYLESWFADYYKERFGHNPLKRRGDFKTPEVLRPKKKTKRKEKTEDKKVEPSRLERPTHISPQGVAPQKKKKRIKARPIGKVREAPKKEAPIENEKGGER